MRLESKPTEVVTSQQFTEFEFGIKSADMGLVLEILRSKLYSNPIGAICREIASNARDANRESENNVPIEIAINSSVISMSDMTISFRDYGPGISPERMADVFVNYGSSTKRESDEYTGGFGLGAKTPFSYTDNFTIETIVAGIKYTYVAAIEEGRKGKIYCVNTEETQDNQGTTIIVPVKPSDRNLFEIEVYKATIFWDMRPVYKNFKTRIEDNGFNIMHDDENFLFVEQSFLSSGYGLLLDGIYYPISSNIMDFASNTVYGYLFVFKFKLGELTISANRETLQYDEKTKIAINKRFVEFINMCKSIYEKQFKENKTWLEASLFSKQFNIYYRALEEQISKKDPYWVEVSLFNNKRLNAKLDFMFKTLVFYHCESDSKTSFSRTRIVDINKKFTEECYLFDKTISFVPLKDATIFSNLTTNGYIAIRPTNPKFLKFSSLMFKEKRSFAKEMRMFLDDVKLLNELGLSYKLYSGVEKMKVTKDESIKNSSLNQRKRDLLKVYVLNILDLGLSSSYSIRKKVGSYTYLKVKNESVTFKSDTELEREKYVLYLVDDTNNIPDINSDDIKMLRFAIRLKLIPDFTIIFANRNRGQKLVSLFGTLEDRIKLLTPSIITQIVDLGHTKDLLNDREWLININFVSKKFSYLVSSLKPFMTKNENLVVVPSDLLAKYEKMSQVSTLKPVINDFDKCFPMTGLLSNYQIMRDLKIINDYINLVEKNMIENNQLV
ncbi:MAG: ATP-binding protein [Candidatus Nanoarchaeia archaeon]|jgi:hypothetical protein|nr:ATP-binding protein [Candidatus Nanoarchaeia archaeon]